MPDPGIPYASGTASSKLATFIFKEEGRLYLMTVGVNATRFHDRDPFIPLTVTVLNRKAGVMNLTRESFTLVDPATGGRYGLASVDEVRRQGKMLYDRRLMDLDHLSGKLEPVNQFVPTRFFPDTGEIVRDQVELHGFQYMLDNLYFPRPEGDLLGKTFELHVTTSDPEAPLFVVFTVPER
ncbi:MAG TPA: hypothetical protein VFP98_09495 [Candidatus Polarisedimenticolia bacterium]|nr:hypothetical protein [Candidatus Polarisedimenticolia bacterium]